MSARAANTRERGAEVTRNCSRLGGALLKPFFGFVVTAVLLVAQGTIARSQTIAGRISGTVADASGAVIPGAKVTITSEATKETRSVTTDESGFYVVTNLPVGDYTVAAEHVGFGKAVRTGNSLVADGRLTVDFALRPRRMAQSVKVTASAGETVNDVSGEIARVVDQSQVQNMALNGRNYMQVISVIPGVALLDEDQLALTTSLSVTGQSVNGNRGNSNHLAVDGGFNLDSGSNGSQINNVGVDFIQEVSVKSSNFSAEYGRNSGAAINVVTRSGSKDYHGNLLEFFRNDTLDATNFFAPIGVSGKKEKGKLRFNNFGWNLGGPIKKDKFFFFAGEEWKSIRRDTDPSRKTLPTRAERLGDFSDRSTTLRFPGTQTAIPGKNISSLMTPDGRAIAAVYDAMEKVAASYVDRPSSNNAIYQMSNPFDWRQDILRLDYRFNAKHSINGRYLHDTYDLVDPFGTFIGSGLPTIPTNRFRPGYSTQVAYTWLGSQKLINEAKFNASWNGQRIPPVGDAWKRDTYSFTFPLLYSGGRFPNGIPDVSISNFTGFRGPAGALLSPVTDISYTDTLTVIRGKHTLKTGAAIIRNRKDQNGRAPYTGSVSFDTNGNNMTTGSAMADALIGNFRTYSEGSADAIGFFRFTQFEAYASDSWKVRRNLSLELGGRYQYLLPIYTEANNIVNFVPSLYDPTQAVTVRLDSTIVPGSGNPLNGLIRAGDGVPANQLGRVPNGNSSAVLAVPAGAPRGLYQPAHLLAPRFSFAWTPFGKGKTVVRGGFGIFYDRPEGNIVFPAVNIPPFINITQFENGNLGDPSAALLGVTGNIDAIDPALKVPYTMNWSLSIQRELPRGIFLEASYVSNNGRNLIRQPDTNQPSFDALVANAALPSSRRASTNALRPYKGYSQIRMRISDSTSNYNSLQLYVNKRKGNLNLTGSYTWSKVLTDASGNGDNPEDPTNKRLNYGPASFDRRQIYVSTYTYSFPFFRSLKGPGGVVLSGWQISGITRAQSGAPFTVTGNTSIGGRRADYLGGPWTLPSVLRTPDHWFNNLAFAPAPNTRRGTSAVGIGTGPSLYLWDISLRKSFNLPRENTKLMFQTDFFNAFNRANFHGLDTNINSGQYDTITSAGPARNIQFGLKLNF